MPQRFPGEVFLQRGKIGAVSGHVPQYCSSPLGHTLAMREAAEKTRKIGRRRVAWDESDLQLVW